MSKKKKQGKSYNLHGKAINHAAYWYGLVFLWILAYFIAGAFYTDPVSGVLDLTNFKAQFLTVITHPFDVVYLNAMTCVLWMLVSVFWLIQYGKAMEKSGKRYMKGKEMGSAKWEDVEAFNAALASPNAGENMILSQKGRKNYDAKKTRLNNNVTIVGGSGAGKGASAVIPNLLENFDCNICTDPKGDTLDTVAEALERKGTLVKALNLCDMDTSLQYNPFLYIKKEKELYQLISNIIANTTPKDQKGGDSPFWDKAELLFDKAIFTYVWKECPQPYYKYTQNPINSQSEVLCLDHLNEVEIYRTPVNDSKGKQQQLTQTFRSVLRLLSEAAVKEDDREWSDLDCRMMVLENQLAAQGKFPESHASLENYNKVMRGAKDTVRSIVISADARFGVFSEESLLRILDDDQMELESIGTGHVKGREGLTKTMLFLVVPDDDSTYNFVVGMLYTQLFQVLYRVARTYPGNQLPMNVGFWMDEFANIKMPDDFEKILSTCRSRRIYIVIILQSLAQLKTLYPQDAWEGVLGNCDTFIYLGGNEKSSHKYVSEILGKWTIDKQTSGETLGKQGSASTNNDILGRELLTEDETSMLPNEECIFKVRGRYPVRDQKYYWFAFPEYDYIKKLPCWKSPVLVKKRGDQLITITYQSTYEFLTTSDLEKAKAQGQPVCHLLASDWFFLDQLSQEYEEEQQKEMERKGAELLASLDEQQLDEQIHQEKQQEEQRYKEKLATRQEMIELIMNVGFDEDQMAVLEETLALGFTIAQIQTIAKPDMSARQMLFLRKAMETSVTRRTS
ncbi:MAG: type IV secretory system conjugative DNA transfer family protein [Lachnospiraceae bacterium]